MFECKESDKVYKIREEDIFTLSAATKRLRIKDLKGVLRNAIYQANGRNRVETYSWWFGDGLATKRSRSFHVAICRPLTEEERHYISEFYKEVCFKENWGNPDLFIKWNVHLQDRNRQHSTGYLENHDQRWFVKASPGPTEERRE